MIEDRRFHLAGDGPLPDQFIKLALITIELVQIFGPAAHIGGADRLVRFLGVLGLGFIDAGVLGHIIGTVGFADETPRLADSLARNGDAVGPHIGDKPDRLAIDVDAFVQPLGDLHGALGGEIQFARGFLLHGRGGERRRRMAPGLLALDLGNGKRSALDTRLGGLGGGFVADRRTGKLFAVQMRQGAPEFAGAGGEFGAQGPIFHRVEFFDLGFALANEAQGHRLYAPRRAAARQFAPQYRRQGKADQIVQRPARQVRIDQLLVQLPRIGKGFQNGGLGDLVEDDALDLDALQKLLLFEDFLYVPGNGFAFAVRIGRQIQIIGALDGAGDLVHMLFRLGIDFPFHGEVVVRAHGTVLRRQITNVAVAGQHLVSVAKIAVDCFGLGR